MLTATHSLPWVKKYTCSKITFHLKILITISSGKFLMYVQVYMPCVSCVMKNCMKEASNVNACLRLYSSGKTIRQEEKLLDIAGKRYDSRKNLFDNYYCCLIQSVAIRLFFCSVLNVIYKMIRPKNYSTLWIIRFKYCMSLYIYVDLAL